MNSDTAAQPLDSPLEPRLAALANVVTSAAAGYAGWTLGETTREYAQVPLEISSKPYQFAELNAANLRVNSINGALVYGGLGLCLLVGAVLAWAIVRKGRGLPLFRILAAIIVATSLSAAPSFLLMPLHVSYADQDPGSLDLTTPLLIHLGLWCPIGAGIGLTFGLIRGGGRHAVIESTITGLFGAALGAVVYEFAGAITMPTGKTHEPIPGTPEARLTAMLCVALGIAISLLYGSLRTKKSAPAVPTAEAATA